jgi:hypothetical protein
LSSCQASPAPCPAVFASVIKNVPFMTARAVVCNPVIGNVPDTRLPSMQRSTGSTVQLRRAAPASGHLRWPNEGAHRFGRAGPVSPRRLPVVRRRPATSAPVGTLDVSRLCRISCQRLARSIGGLPDAVGTCRPRHPTHRRCAGGSRPSAGRVRCHPLVSHRAIRRRDASTQHGGSRSQRCAA